MSALDSVLVQCPYCWETLDLSVDPSVEDQEYVEDCQVCWARLPRLAEFFQRPAGLLGRQA